MDKFSQILMYGYKLFILNIEGKEVPMPYRINIPPTEHPNRQGKSAPEVTLTQLIEDAKQQGFDLKSASVEEIREFMGKNSLGIDCSGFVYRMLDYLAKGIKGKPLTEFGFDHVGRTNVNTLTSAQFSTSVDNNSDIQPGDIIKTNSNKKIPHCMVVLEVTPEKIIYVHSTDHGKINGVQTNEAARGSQLGDEVRRLNLWSLP